MEQRSTIKQAVAFLALLVSSLSVQVQGQVIARFIGRRCMPWSEDMSIFSDLFGSRKAALEKRGDLPVEIEGSKRSTALLRSIINPPAACQNSTSGWNSYLGNRPEVCPAKRVISRSRNRVPRDLVEVRCLCPRSPYLPYNCEAKKAFVKVMFYDPSCDGYRLAENAVQVGCVAVKPSN